MLSKPKQLTVIASLLFGSVFALAEIQSVAGIDREQLAQWLTDFRMSRLSESSNPANVDIRLVNDLDAGTQGIMTSEEGLSRWVENGPLRWLAHGSDGYVVINAGNPVVARNPIVLFSVLVHEATHQDLGAKDYVAAGNSSASYQAYAKGFFKSEVDAYYAGTMATVSMSSLAIVTGSYNGLVQGRTDLATVKEALNESIASLTENAIPMSEQLFLATSAVSSKAQSLAEAPRETLAAQIKEAAVAVSEVDGSRTFLVNLGSVTFSGTVDSGRQVLVIDNISSNGLNLMSTANLTVRLSRPLVPGVDASDDPFNAVAPSEAFLEATRSVLSTSKDIFQTRSDELSRNHGNLYAALGKARDVLAYADTLATIGETQYSASGVDNLGATTSDSSHLPQLTAAQAKALQDAIQNGGDSLRQIRGGDGKLYYLVKLPPGLGGFTIRVPVEG